MGTVGQTNTISVGDDFTAAIKTDGSLWMWGYNGFGELGTGDTEKRYTPVKILDGVMLPSGAMVAAKFQRFCEKVMK